MINKNTRTREADEQASAERSTAERVEETCPECEGTVVTDEEHGERVCSDCGLVVETDSIDRGPEWRAFDSAERDNKSRVGAPTTTMMHDKGLSTNIGWQDKDAYGKTLSSRQRRQMQRLRTWNERFRTREMASALGLPENVRETASVIYRRALDEDLLPGRSIEGVATASLYASARQAGMPRSLDEIARVSRVDRMELTRTYRYVVRELSLEIQPADPESYVPRFASDLDLSDETERRARDLLRNAKGTAILSGKSPVGLAAAAVYAASLLTNQAVTQSQVSDVADISEVTIRNRYKELLEIEEPPVPA
jgi:transcription initiation factor TFIIB